MRKGPSFKKQPDTVIKTPLESMVEKIQTGSAFVYGCAEYDYDSYRPCRDDLELCSDYCRCGIIQNARVTSVDADFIVKAITKDCNDTMLVYCVDRALRASKALDVHSWEVNVCGGYYGEEVHGVRLEPHVQEELIKMISELEGLTPVEMIKKVLEYEYGYVLPRLQKCTEAKIITLPLDLIKLFNDEYLRKVSKETVDFYQKYDLPRGICVFKSGCYSLVDGYHRMLAAQKSGADSVSIIEMS